jgi:peptidoglycan hydrolase-like protein with peptidoglycan-binding domain
MTKLALLSLTLLAGCGLFSPTPAPAPAPPAATVAAQHTAMAPDYIKGVQDRLRQDGYYTGKTDGVWGPATRAALVKYQQQHDVYVSGELDAATLKSFAADDNPPVVQAPPAPEPAPPPPDKPAPYHW